MKVCRKCGQPRPVDEFYRDKSKKSGRQTTCKRCNYERRAAWVAANPDKAKARWRQYYAANRGSRVERSATYREANKDKIRSRKAEWHAANREQIKQKRDEHYRSARGRYMSEGAFAIPKETLAREVTYSGAHRRVKYFYGYATTHRCEGVGCERPAAAWALISTETEHLRHEWLSDTRNPDKSPKRVPYSLNPQDYRPLCLSCHNLLDRHDVDILAVRIA